MEMGDIVPPLVGGVIGAAARPTRLAAVFGSGDVLTEVMAVKTQMANRIVLLCNDILKLINEEAQCV
jgi:hypothetical protein